MKRSASERVRRMIRKSESRRPKTRRCPTIPLEVDEQIKGEIPEEVLSATSEDTLFLDLETTGLMAHRSLTAMIGILYRRNDTLRLSQWYSGDVSTERKQLDRLYQWMASFRTVVTYNGDGFDLPFLRHRAQWHGLETENEPQSVDLLPIIRRHYKKKWPNCRLVTAEERLLGIPRCADDVPGSEAPLRFQDLREGSPLEVITPIYTHNRRDLISLVSLHHRLVAPILMGE